MPALNETPEDGKPNGERIAKVIARSGLCSRRDAEVLIGEKRVSVNGAVIESAALDVSPSDKVLVDGKPLAMRQPPRLWRFHKPKGRVTTHKDPEGRPTVFDALPENLPRLISVGRLDFNTEGLLLLTNDGDLARHLELPSTGWTRRYRVRAFGRIEQSKLDELAAGLRTDGVNYGPIEATLEREQGDNVWITLSIREGKNREVRRIMEHLGLSVNRLIRVSFGPFILGDIEPGQIEEVKTSVLKDQLGPRLARQFGVKREPVREERRLPPARSKPTYLRRKQDAVERPERLREERPMKRRRILAEGDEAAKVELVPDKKWRPARFARGGEGGSEQGAFRRRAERPEDRKRPGDTRPARHRAETGEDRRGPSAGERPRWKSSADRSGEGGPEQRTFRRHGEKPEREDRERPSGQMIASIGAEKRGPATIVQSAEKTGPIRTRENGHAGNRTLTEAAKGAASRERSVRVGKPPRSAGREGRDRISAGMETNSARRPPRSQDEKAPNETNAVLTGSAERKKAAATAIGRSRLRSAFSAVKTAATRTGARAADAKPKRTPQKARRTAGGRGVRRGVRRGRREGPRAPARAGSRGSSRSAGTRTVQSVACAREERAASPSSPALVRRKGRVQAPRANRDRKPVRKPRENRRRALSRAIHSCPFGLGYASYIRPGPRVAFQYSRAWRERLQH